MQRSRTNVIAHVLTQLQHKDSPADGALTTLTGLGSSTPVQPRRQQQRHDNMATIMNATLIRHKRCATFARNLHQDADHTQRPKSLHRLVFCLLRSRRQQSRKRTSCGAEMVGGSGTPTHRDAGPWLMLSGRMWCPSPSSLVAVRPESVRSTGVPAPAAPVRSSCARRCSAHVLTSVLDWMRRNCDGSSERVSCACTLQVWLLFRIDCGACIQPAQPSLDELGMMSWGRAAAHVCWSFPRCLHQATLAAALELWLTRDICTPSRGME